MVPAVVVEVAADEAHSIEDVALFLDPHTFFSFITEEKDKAIVYVSHMNADVLKVINQVPDKVEGKHVLFHFESCLDDKHSPKYNFAESIAAPGNTEELFGVEDVPLYGLRESLRDLKEETTTVDEYGFTITGPAILSSSDEDYADIGMKVTTYISSKE